MKFLGVLGSRPAVYLVLLAGVLSRCRARLVRPGSGGVSLRAIEAKVYPVTKVVTLLRDMQKQLEKEADEDEEIYEKMDCWCKTNNKEKTQAIADAQVRITQLETVIEETVARSARLGAEIKNHEEDLVKSQKSLDEETAIRAKQAEEFHGEEKLMLENIRALDSAIVVLSKHHSGAASSLLDNGDSGEVAQAVRLARSMMQSHEMMLLDAISPDQRRLIMAFPQLHQEPGPGTGYVGQQPTFKQSYAPQSSEIFGILKQMKDTFEQNLGESQKDELANAKAFEELKAAKMAEIQATQQALEQKKTQLAETDSKNAQARQDVEDTKESLGSDQRFLLELQESCKMTDEEWESRQKLRAEEIQAVAKAISVLTSDEARDQFSKTFNPSLLQERSEASPARPQSQFERERDLRAADAKKRYQLRLAHLAQHLSGVARKVHSTKLLALSATMRIDPLKRVMVEIDKLIDELKEESQVESKKRDSCVDLLHQNDKQTEDFTRQQETLQSQEAAKKAELSETVDAIKTLTAEVAELQVQIKRAGEDREAENKEFQQTISDQRETQVLLQKALEILKVVYKPVTESAALVQQAPGGSDDGQPAPPPGFETYGRNRAGGGVVGMIEQIISDAKHMEAMAAKDEQNAQTQYEAFVRDTNEALKAKQDGLVNKGEVKARAEGKLIEIAEDIQNAHTELETLANTLATLKQDCDFLLRNFEIRRDARLEEIEALQEAKAVLAGMKLG